MALDELLLLIESTAFAIEAGLVSGYHSFQQITRKKPLTHELIVVLFEAQEVQIQLLSRVINLTSVEFNTQYANPYDTALAVYIDALSFFSPDLAKIGAQAVSNSENCYWAIFAANRLLSSSQSS